MTTKRKWTEAEDDELIACYQNKQAMASDVATKLGRSRRSVYGRAKYLGLKTSKNWTKEEIKLLKKLRAIENFSSRYIGRIMGRTAKAVGQCAVRLGFYRNTSPMRWAKEVAEYHAVGMTDAEIGRKVGRSNQYIGSIRKALGLPKHKRKTKIIINGMPLGEIRADQQRAEVVRAGWPPGCSLSVSRILEIVEANGKTGWQDCARITGKFREICRSRLRSAYKSGWLHRETVKTKKPCGWTYKYWLTDKVRIRREMFRREKDAN